MERVKGELGKSAGIPCLGLNSPQAQSPPEDLGKWSRLRIGLRVPQMTIGNHFSTCEMKKTSFSEVRMSLKAPGLSQRSQE